eukprot:TRINITY_DN4777_c0_g1_i3.p1 TRINITY_DN4777_c0_g1~~TRINITY_DN4777_c0_g1_i3.p1  ORF type:complete len:268 (+),score=30.04 TRINITY_DN4777_c0_g1_i3:55-804(+)
MEGDFNVQFKNTEALISPRHRTQHKHWKQSSFRNSRHEDTSTERGREVNWQPSRGSTRSEVSPNKDLQLSPRATTNRMTTSRDSHEETPLSPRSTFLRSDANPGKCTLNQELEGIVPSLFLASILVSHTSIRIVTQITGCKENGTGDSCYSRTEGRKNDGQRSLCKGLSVLLSQFQCVLIFLHYSLGTNQNSQVGLTVPAPVWKKQVFDRISEKRRANIFNANTLSTEENVAGFLPLWLFTLLFWFFGT